jgi:seryl-tRNA synthetase
MKPSVSGEEVLGYVENRAEEVAKIDGLKAQIKAINDDIGESTKIAAKEFEVKAKDLNAVYKRYTEIKDQGDEETDYYELLSLLEAALEEESPVVDDDEDE